MKLDSKCINLLRMLYEAEVELHYNEIEWTESSKDLIDYIQTKKLECPEIIWHYLSDYEIRLNKNNSEYKMKQFDAIGDFLSS